MEIRLSIPERLGSKLKKVAELEKLTVEESVVAMLLQDIPNLTTWWPIERGKNKGRQYRLAFGKRVRAAAKRALRAA